MQIKTDELVFTTDLNIEVNGNPGVAMMCSLENGVTLMVGTELPPRKEYLELQEVLTDIVNGVSVSGIFLSVTGKHVNVCDTSPINVPGPSYTFHISEKDQAHLWYDSSCNQERMEHEEID